MNTGDTLPPKNTQPNPAYDIVKQHTDKLKNLLLVTVWLMSVGAGAYGGYLVGLYKFETTKKVIQPNVVTITPSKASDSALCGIKKTRLSDVINSGGNQYYIYQRNSMNVDLPGNDYYTDTGVFMVDTDTANNCQKLIEINDQSQSANNIYEFLIKDNVYYVLVVDQIGGGSGEGQAKVLKSTDYGKIWELDSCFYYTPEDKFSLSEYDQGPRNGLPLDNPYCKNFVLSKAGGKLK